MLSASWNRRHNHNSQLQGLPKTQKVEQVHGHRRPTAGPSANYRQCRDFDDPGPERIQGLPEETGCSGAHPSQKPFWLCWWAVN